MADFPLFIKMDGRKVMVIGGGFGGASGRYGF